MRGQGIGEYLQGCLGFHPPPTNQVQAVPQEEKTRGPGTIYWPNFQMGVSSFKESLTCRVCFLGLEGRKKFVDGRKEGQPIKYSGVFLLSS